MLAWGVCGLLFWFLVCVFWLMMLFVNAGWLWCLICLWFIVFIAVVGGLGLMVICLVVLSAWCCLVWDVMLI